MNDLISREALRREIRGWQEDIHDNEYDANRYDFVFNRIYEMLDEAFVVDGVEVVRCKDCERWDAFADGLDSAGYCYKWHNNVQSDGYCYYGEHKVD